MKKIPRLILPHLVFQSILLLPSFLLFPAFVFSQCASGSCPAGAITTLPAGCVIAVGSTYCLS